MSYSLVKNQASTRTHIVHTKTEKERSEILGEKKNKFSAHTRQMMMMMIHNFVHNFTKAIREEEGKETIYTKTKTKNEKNAKLHKHVSFSLGYVALCVCVCLLPQTSPSTC